MNALTSLALKGFAVCLILAAAAAIFLAGRLSLRLRQKYWSGDKIGGAESDQTRTRILALRIAAGACGVAAAVALIAAATLQAYQAV